MYIYKYIYICIKYNFINVFRYRSVRCKTRLAKLLLFLFCFLYLAVFSFFFTTPVVLFWTYGFYLQKSFIMHPGQFLHCMLPQPNTAVTISTTANNNIIILYTLPRCLQSPRILSVPSPPLTLLFLSLLHRSSFTVPFRVSRNHIINITVIIIQIYRVVIIIMTPPRRISTIIIQRVLVTSPGRRS